MLAVASPAVLIACEGRPPTTAQPDAAPAPLVFARPDAAAGVDPQHARGVVESVVPWSFGSAEGRAITTANFVIRTTETQTAITDRLPSFMEAALVQYRSAVVPLGEPARRLESYVMNDRRQWQELVMEKIGPAARPATSIRRGGLTFRGQAMLFDIGAGDTLAIAAHEGWHQYSQATFAQLPPVWVEEGMAVYMEGHRTVGREVVFSAWANTERYDRLKIAHQRGELLPLETLLTTTPGGMLGVGGSGGAPASETAINQQTPVVWYSQVWALMHMLAEGHGGRDRAALQQLILDARDGVLAQEVYARLGLDSGRRGTSGAAPGLLVYRAYFNRDLAAADAELREWIKTLTANGVRSDIVNGRTPAILSRVPSEP